MTSIIRETGVAATPEAAWRALRDFGAIHELASGFVTSTKLEGDRTRVVTFFNGATAREALIGTDEQAHRIAWTIIDLAGATHHSGSAQILATVRTLAAAGSSGPPTCSPMIWQNGSAR